MNVSEAQWREMISEKRITFVPVATPTGIILAALLDGGLFWWASREGGSYELMPWAGQQEAPPLFVLSGRAPEPTPCQ